MTVTATSLIAQPFIQCAREGDLEGFDAAFASVKVNELSALGKEAAFHASLRDVADIALSGESPSIRLRALSLVGKANSATQKREPAIADIARHALRIEPPKLEAEGDNSIDADAREYIADLLAYADAPWVLPWAARMLLDEAKSNVVRKALSDIILSRAETIADAFRLIVSAVRGSRHEAPGTKEIELTRFRRLVRLCIAIEEAIRISPIESGADLTEALKDLLHALAFRFSPPTQGSEGPEETEKAGAQILLLVSTLVRTHFSISTDPASYGAVAGVQRWMGRRSWPDGLKDARDRLSQSVREAIALRARMQQPSRELFAVLVQLAGDRRIAERQIRPIADLQGLAPDIQDWLRNGARDVAVRKSSDTLVEAGLRDADDLIALAAIRSLRLQALADGDASEALARLRQIPAAADSLRPLSQLVSFSRAVPQDLAMLLSRRSLELFGTPGEQVEPDLNSHEQADGRIIDSALVSITVPGVRRVFPNGTTTIIRKAIVRPV